MNEISEFISASWGYLAAYTGAMLAFAVIFIGLRWRTVVFAIAAAMLFVLMHVHLDGAAGRPFRFGISALLLLYLSVEGYFRWRRTDVEPPSGPGF